jgi:hypothetical protein
MYGRKFTMSGCPYIGHYLNKVLACKHQQALRVENRNHLLALVHRQGLIRQAVKKLNLTLTRSPEYHCDYSSCVYVTREGRVLQ